VRGCLAVDRSAPRYDLPDPQAIFDLEYFQERPAAFYQLAKEMWPDKYV
jgi:NAD-dependent SIR2 family protein deacetylase